MLYQILEQCEESPTKERSLRKGSLTPFEEENGFFSREVLFLMYNYIIAIFGTLVKALLFFFSRESHVCSFSLRFFSLAS
jgi:hypothetical protein